MSDNIIVKAVAGTCVTFSFIIVRKCNHAVVYDRPSAPSRLPTPRIAGPCLARKASRSSMAAVLDSWQPILPPNFDSRFPRLRICWVLGVPGRRSCAERLEAVWCCGSHALDYYSTFGVEHAAFERQIGGTCGARECEGVD
ncbi:hypothetical protein SNOG_12705 [Parastagonospora nodorum SN15]|uniref:Uncharacterized protein n=1 Tax=Phaeosphaeria nodorum (strain SN15 / ATCC MYA-4574 / FGSC 10173) TaxID=321614 RepID=Q0U6A9_PHANO|nr:hypothetical protein SNOG_12705 [Parastagonospora nodorum SN15]EAT80003.2 hypothetical protein SNOG_12705 [Parastagonospora nodorum SN15]